MRRIPRPAKGQPQIEDFVFQFFATDPVDNIGVRTERMEIPLNCGKYVKEASVLGYFGAFDTLIGESGGEQSDALFKEYIDLMEKIADATANDIERQKRIRMGIVELKSFQGLVKKSRESAAKKAAEQQKAQPAHAAKPGPHKPEIVKHSEDDEKEDAGPQTVQ